MRANTCRLGILGLAALAIVGAAQVAFADDDLAPFRPPLNWQSFPSMALMSRSVLSWSDGTAMLRIVKFQPPLPIVNMRKIYAESSAVAKIISSSDANVCGQRASRATVQYAASSPVRVHQQQSLDGATYLLSYSYPSSTAPNADILRMLDGFCGNASLANPILPAGWRANDANVIGTWVDFTAQMAAGMGDSSNRIVGEHMHSLSSGPDGTLTLFSLRPDSSVGRLARVASTIVGDGDGLTIESVSQTALCGNAAALVAASTLTADGTRSELRIAVTQSATRGYALAYSYPALQQPNAVAIASLKTLCAN